jgi:hypothetical protein
MFVSVLLSLQIAMPPPKTKPEEYVGAQVCGECHPKEYASQSKSSHVRALHRAGEVGAFSFLPVKSVHESSDPDSASFEFRIASRELSVAASRGPNRIEIPVQWIFGSGVQGLTFFSRLRDGAYLEHRFSYYSRIGDYDITTGQSTRPAGTLEQAVGLQLTSGNAFQCLSCHATVVKQTPSGPDFDSVVPGVTCERCHGPGGAHIEAVKTGAPDRHIRDLRKLSGDELVMFCGECHRTDPPPGVNFDDPIATRFQAVGLQMSTCFQQSNGALNCVTCHNPHEDAHRGDDVFYDRRCLGCHGTRAVSQCKVQSSGCVSCHMPRVTPVPHLSFADHWIRVRSQAGSPHS